MAASLKSPGGSVRILSKLVGSRSAVLAMALSSVLAMVGCASNNSSSSGNNGTATPTFTPGAGTYNASQTVTIADSTQGAVLYCTTDGTTPTTSSPVCSQPTTVFKTEFLQAIAVAPGKAPSAAASAGYTIDLNAAATPSFSPSGGTYTASQMVTISDTTTGANIYYTTDGTTPSASSTLYTGPVTVSQTETLSAVAVASGFNNSGVAVAQYTIAQTVLAPTFSVATGNYTAPQTVTITDATAGATIFYTLDGSIPSASSMKYSAPITVSTTQVVSAIAVLSGNSSSVAVAAYSISAPAPAAPTFTPAGGSINAGSTVTIADATAGASIFYTTDGSQPSSSSTPYAGPITLNTSGAATLNAVAILAGVPSTVSSASFTVNAVVAAPSFSPASGTTVTSGQTITLSDTTAGASIYYTTDGSTPSASSTPYTAPIALNTVGSATINAIAIVSGTSSGEATASYTVAAALPTITGTILSGTTPVNGASVQLYAAGQTGYGLDPTPLLTTPVTTKSDGTFALPYSCPAQPGDLLYIVATGGSVGTGSANSSLSLMTALGSCNSPSFVKAATVNEATTVASAYALSGFMTVAPNVGTSSTNYQGLANAFATVANLVSLGSGQALTMTPAYSANLAGDPNIVNNSTVPQTRIDTLANALNTCTASDGGGNCSGLFTAAMPQNGSAPTDTLQAILNVAQNPALSSASNPGNNAATLFTVASSSSAFQPVLAAAPNDWTLALTFTGAGLGLAPGTSGTTPGGFEVLPLFNSALAIDQSGNVWIAAYPPSSSGRGTSVVAEFNNQGTPITPATVVNASTISVGGYLADSIGQVYNPTAMAVDPSGFIWVSGSSNPNGNGATINLAQISPDLSSLNGPFSIQEPAATMAIDGTGNVWVGETGGNLEEFGGGNALSGSGYHGTPSSANPGGFSALSQLVFDSTSSGNLWGEDNDGFGDMDLINTSNGTITYDPFFAPGGVFTPIAADGSGNVYGCADVGGQTLDVLNATAQSIVTKYSIPTGRSCGGQMAIDGTGHIFTVSGGTQAPGIIDEYVTTGGSAPQITQVSPSTGYTGTSSGETVTINPDPTNQTKIAVTNFSTYQTTYMPASGVQSVAIDGSGNLWVLNPDTGASTSSKGNVLVKFVGVGAPVVTPTSLALQFGEVGVRP
jgi:hypothetical protein